MLVALSATMAWGQPGPTAPTAGVVRDAKDAMRMVWGVRGNFLLSPPMLEATRTVAFSGRFAMVKTASEILVLDASMRAVARAPTKDGPALLAFTRDGAPLLAYVPSAGLTYRWLGNRLVSAPRWKQDLTGKLVALAASEPGTVTVIVERAGSLWLLKRTERDGRVVHEAPMPGIQAPVYLHDDGTLIFASEGCLVVRRLVGFDQRLRLPVAVTGFERMCGSWVHVEGGGRSPGFAVHLDEAGAELFALPGGRP
jgi:hypothetical protein